ncbi:hypothetical protein J6590_098696 [Homalodisca vitripennis]|nr:hypothetical protein J6590_098696 [Homalodisca vitripennis]
MFVGEIGRQSSYLEGGGVAPTEDLLFITNLLLEILGESGQNESLKGFCQRKKREIGSCQCSESRIWWLRRAGTEAPRSHLHP